MRTRWPTIVRSREAGGAGHSHGRSLLPARSGRIPVEAKHPCSSTPDRLCGPGDEDEM